MKQIKQIFFVSWESDFNSKGFWWQKPGSNSLGERGSYIKVTETLSSFRLVLEEKADRGIPKQDTWVINVKDFNSGLLRGGDITCLPLIWTLASVSRKSWQQSFSEVIEFLILIACASLADSRINLLNNFAKNSSTEQNRNVISLGYGCNKSSWKLSR